MTLASETVEEAKLEAMAATSGASQQHTDGVQNPDGQSQVSGQHHALTEAEMLHQGKYGDGQRVVFQNDDETIAFLHEKIQIYNQEINKINNAWLILQNFKVDFEQLRQIEHEKKTAELFATQEQLNEFRNRLQQQREFLYAEQLIDEHC